MVALGLVMKQVMLVLLQIELIDWHDSKQNPKLSPYDGSKTQKPLGPQLRVSPRQGPTQYPPGNSGPVKQLPDSHALPSVQRDPYLGRPRLTFWQRLLHGLQP